MNRLTNKIARIIIGCDESLRLIVTTAALVALILGGLALQGFAGGVMVGLGLGIILLSLAGVVYEQYIIEQRQSAKKPSNSAESTKKDGNSG